ncbi:PREDICTED: mitochondrial ribosome-associated GTPase 1 [Populus euphratica]|uniref:Mitochondrial ribosome-associated GTPase 1 n=1 Tax=Populus euphratica TaxID=75702 RepID=A0AAJ6X0S2_POPEU|nr:PREDICTED: mitochondrial ribosome-associated GTPase 1 [Populus euphratica]
MGMASRSIGLKEIGEALKKAKSGWYSLHMAAASHAIAQRIPLVDFILEVRDARIPLSSHCQLLSNFPPSSLRRIIVMNKTDLANRSQLKDWTKYFEQQNCISYGVNSHNKENVNDGDIICCSASLCLQCDLLCSQETKDGAYSVTFFVARKPRMESGILDQRTIYLPLIFQIGSHPNIYVLDTPGILPPQIHDSEVCTKLALTGAIENLVGEKELARYFLAILNTSDGYKKWERLSTHGNDKSFTGQEVEGSSDSKLNMKRKRQYPSDHTQDFMVNRVRRTLFESISCLDGNVQNEKDLEELIEVQFTALREAFLVSLEPVNDSQTKISAKLLNLYRTGRLGHYTLDPLPL